MTLISDIITQAFREGNVIPIGQTPNQDEVDEALPRLNNFIQSLFGFELGIRLIDVTIPLNADEDLPLGMDEDNGFANVRFLSRAIADTTVKLFSSPSDGAQVMVADAGASAALILDPQQRLIDGSSSVTIPSGSLPRRWLYRADLGQWIEIKTLATTDESPLPVEFDDLLIAALAMRIAPRFGVEPLSGTVQTYSRLLSVLKTRYQQTVEIRTSTEGVQRDLFG